MISVMHRASGAYQVARTLGPGWLATRARHEIRVRSGYLRYRLPVMTWDQVPLASALVDPTIADPERYLDHRRHAAPRFFFGQQDRSRMSSHFAAWDRQRGGPLPVAAALAHGRLYYFSNADAVLGMPPDWHLDPFSGTRMPSDRHWSQISDFGGGDIKVIWEPSRFRFAFDLVRAYWRDQDNRHAESFWQLLESWRASNPPNLGPNWKCGQETSLRVMAWCFALYGLLDAPATTPKRVAMLGQMIAFSGTRIETTLDYALTQRNNHGISEGTGLWTIGALFPELAAASRWKRLGREVLERLGRELIYDDGAFSQHSANYHRLMLHDYVWSSRLGEIVGDPFSAELSARVGNAADLLYQMQDETTGWLPNYGANDGALILPLSNCHYRDYRPIIQAARYLATSARTFADGPWDEDLFWLFGSTAHAAPIEPPVRHDLKARISGYYTLRGKDGFLYTRCPERYVDRPGHADALHVDVWWRGINIAQDAGSFSYNAPAPWDDGLARTALHNTVTVDHASQMERVGRFLWAPWLRGIVSHDARSLQKQIAYLEGTHDGYNRLAPPVTHRRGIAQLGPEHWLIVDELASEGIHDYQLHWLLVDVPGSCLDKNHDGTGGTIRLPMTQGEYLVHVGTESPSAPMSLVTADPDSPRGWVSSHYQERTPALSAVTAARGATTQFWTLMGPEILAFTVTPDRFTISLTSGTFVVTRGRQSHEPLVKAIHGQGPHFNDLLRVAG